MMKKPKTEREYRSVLELRTKDSDEYIVEGYATTFNQPYTLIDTLDFKFREQISPDAFRECDMSDVIMQYDHEGKVFARTRNETLELSVDSKGLFVRANLGGTEQGRQLYSEIKGGYVDRMSFGFTVPEDGENRTYTTDNEGIRTCLRTITKIGKLYDVSAVSIPANDTTSISARKYCDGVIAELEAERLQRAEAKAKLELKLKLMED